MNSLMCNKISFSCKSFGTNVTLISVLGCNFLHPRQSVENLLSENIIKDEKRYNLAADSICDKILQSKAHGANHIVSTGHLSNLNSAQIRARADLGRGG